ncbi:MAG: nitrogenase-stabilizing/protective protein NifW [Rhodocyclaceae bacterium]|nr:nitrogenase-stabilizing/protective protein NifW [Rhodocyclaceae bacterium]
MDEPLTLEEAMEELSSAEDFLDYLGIAYDPAVVNVSRLHILQRFRDYVARIEDAPPEDPEERKGIYRHWLARAYGDFVHSSGVAEKVFAVFHHRPMDGGGTTSFVPVDKAFR